MNKIIAYLILIFTIGFNAWLYFPETRILADPNDDVFQFSLVQRTNWVWQNYGCPFSLSCLPNLVDHNVPTWAEGYPLPIYYSHIPQITLVASYNLIINPLLSLYPLPFTLFQYYHLTKYLLMVFFPLSVFLALKIVGFSPVVSAIGALFSAHLSTDGLYGIDPPSFLWRGYGLTSQLYAMIFAPLALAFTYRTLSSLHSAQSHKLLKLPKLLRWKDEIFSVLFLILTTSGHLGIGLIVLISTLSFLFFDFDIRRIIVRFTRLAVILSLVFFVLSYWIIPVLLLDKYHMISFWDPIWKFNSYGWYEVIRQYLAGEIFDWKRWPVITVLVTIGFFVTVINSQLLPFAILFVFWMFMYFGRTTWGGLIDLIPGMKDFHQHRFLVGIQFASLFLIPAGFNYIMNFLRKITDYLGDKTIFLKAVYNHIAEVSSEDSKKTAVSFSELKKIVIPSDFKKRSGFYKDIFFILSILIIVPVIIYLTVYETYDYASLNNRWIYEANSAYRYDEKNFENTLSFLNTLAEARIYAGRPGNWGKQFRLGSTELYMLLGVHNYNMSQFLPETWSPLSENEQNFDERIKEDYDLLNIRYNVAPKNEDFTPSARSLKKFGPFEVFEIPTTGWFDIVSSPMLVKTDKTNFLNLVQLWHRSYARRWKMHPVITVEKDSAVPYPMRRTLNMVDEVSYEEDNPQPITHNSQQYKNIFSDFPFVFPPATPSGEIKSESVNKQTYSATVNVPQNCEACTVMFKMSYHPDWEVKVDGQPAAKYSVFPFYLATSISPGTHTVEFTYEPNKLKVILIYSTFFILIIFLIWKFTKIR